MSSSDITLKRYHEWSPSQFDPSGLGCADQQQWYVAPCIQSRDSGIREEANWEAMLKLFAEKATEGETYQIHEFGHWACGWFRIVLIDPSHDTLVNLAQSIGDGLSDYPILCENTYSRHEWEATVQTWQNMSGPDRRAKIRARADYQKEKISSRDLDKWVKRREPPREFDPHCGWAELLGIHDF